MPWRLPRSGERGMSGEGRSAIVIGGGIEGLSAASALARRRVAMVTVLERSHLGSGMTSRSSGVVRCHYGIPSLAAMAWRSLGVLEAFGGDAGFHQSGYLVGVGEDNVAPLHANVAMQQDLGIDVEIVDHARAGALWPSAKLDDFAAFAYEARGGYGDGYQTAQAFANSARLHGATLMRKTPVAKVVETKGEVAGVTLADGSDLRADVVVVAAGAWSRDLLMPLGIDLPVRAQQTEVVIIDPPKPMGPTPVLSDLVSLQYLRPDNRGSILAGSSDHGSPRWVDPDRFRGRIDWEAVNAAVAKFEHRLPGLSGSVMTSSYAGLYDATPDYNPVISATAVGGLYVAAGFSGHGYKISPAVGELVADLVETGTSQYPNIDHRDFRLERFAQGAPLRSSHPYAGASEMR